MKKMLQMTAASVLALTFSSCCGLFPCGKGETVTREVTEMQEVEREIMVGSAKDGMRTETVVDQVAVTRTVEEEVECPDCLSIYCPDPGCCGTTSEVVIQRRTAQGGTGNPHIGLIPTMKPLVAPR